MTRRTDRNSIGGSGSARATFGRRRFLSVAGGVAGAAATGLGATGCSGVANGTTEPGTLRFAFEGPPGSGHEIAANIFGRTLEKVSDSQLRIEQYPSGQLGGEAKLLPAIRSGDIDFTISSTANAAQIAKPSAIFSLHYIYSGRSDVIRVVSDSAVNDAYANMARNHVDGAFPLTLFALPLRNLYGTKPIRHVDELTDVKIRVQATPTESRVFGAYGAQTVQMSFTELYTALQTGVVDMAENSIAYYGLNKHQEICPVMSMTQHSGNTQVIWVSERCWEELSAREREWVSEAAMEVRDKQPAADFEAQKDFKKEYADSGVTFVEDVDRESFAKVSVALYEEIAERLGPEAQKILRLVRDLTGGEG